MSVASVADASMCAVRLRVLAESTRLAVLRLLARGARSAGEIATELGVEQTLLSHHLALLRQARLVQVRREGKRRVYEPSPSLRVCEGRDEIELGCCRIRFSQAS